MHRAYFRFCAFKFFGGACGGGSSDLHAVSAAWYVGFFGSMSEPGWALSRMPPLASGSGKSLIPCVRMHREYASALALGKPLDAVPDGDEEMVATPGPPAPELLHAAANTPQASRAGIRRAIRRVMVSSFVDQVGQLHGYEGDGFAPVSTATA